MAKNVHFLEYSYYFLISTHISENFHPREFRIEKGQRTKYKKKIQGK